MRGGIDRRAYEDGMRAYIDEAVAFQEEVGLDVLVHGEPERNDMVEYFGDLLEGCRRYHQRLGAELWVPLCEASHHLR